QNNQAFFIHNNSYASVHKIREWLTVFLHSAGVPNGFRLHDIRKCATSKMLIKVYASTEEILRAGDWSNIRTFREFYWKDLVKLDNRTQHLQNVVLSE